MAMLYQLKIILKLLLKAFSLTCVTMFFRWIVLSCDSGMHIASFQDGTAPLSDLEYAKGELHIKIYP